MGGRKGEESRGVKKDTQRRGYRKWGRFRERMGKRGADLENIGVGAWVMRREMTYKFHCYF